MRTMAVEFSTHFGPLETDLVSAIAALSERVFEPPTIDHSWRLTHMPQVSVFCAHASGTLVGFKAGYAIAERRYYSWLGAVHPQYRGQGVAIQLTHMQHQWLSTRGYSTVETSTRSSNSAMAHINFRSGFVVVGSKQEPHGLQVLWSKALFSFNTPQAT